ncbi:MAG: hypothetical protein JXL97_12635 [Bacteroidales bacterium]|nr:hypothetical protein [Bacteroidales bacterium]
MKKIGIAFFLIFLGFIGFSQNEVDAFRFSEAFYGGTARSMSMGGAFGALGADLSTASTNPAGIGVYKNSSLSFSPSVNMNNTNASFAGTNATNDKLSMMFNNVGLTFGIRDKDGTLKALNFAFGYNRYNNFAQNYNITGVNNNGSMLDALMFDANGTHPDFLNAYTTFPAWDTWLLDTLPGTLKYTNPLWWTQTGDDKPLYGQTVSKTGQVKGGGGETFFTGAINYNDFFYFGATIGLQSFSYNSMTVYTESSFVDNDDLKSFSYTENLTDNGTGINMKLGFLLRPADFIRFGAAIHTPTYFDINDKYSVTANSYWNSPDANGYYNYESDSPSNNYNFTLLTPMRLMGNLGIIIGKFALIGVDYEYVDYSTMRLSASDYMFTDENENIREDFKPAHNLKGGVELRLGMMSLRGGYAYFGNPYNNENSYEKSQITGGIGFSSKNVYVDFAYIHDVKTYNVYFYNGYPVEPVPELTAKNGIINITMGLRF